ncbi:MAG: peptidylprolyl isomerase [Methylobacter sp.]|nr:peptidylprolyl isomerase [Methylobacter sp.]MDP2428501.1 peptidylprolyl isomerase [Methylobacter sp.]MDP3056245.1 peptidylprolyl isomerase [Methylobacter sp.]MDP3363776.1 peptidylprolyl isomerase [Methylobacter sp.]MDZ4219312.1 peptidylprolyl isomerase [Methylobacter sp.]
MKKFIPLLIVGTALIAGCDQETTTGSAPTTSTAPKVDKADAVAVVNGQYIAKSTLEALEKEIAERSHGQTFPKEKLIEELVQRELLVQDALQKQLNKSPEFVAQLESAKTALLTQATLQNFIKANPVTDEEIKAEYDSKVAAEKGIEFKARHILVKTEEEAKKIIAELDKSKNKSADFAKLANKHSLDAKESQNGGDLGWFSGAQMVAPFSEAVAALEKDKYSKEPVKTQFGFHVILKEDSRALTPPPLEAVKEQLMPFLQRKKVQNMIETLRTQAKVEILIPLEQPQAEAAPAPAASTQAVEEKPAAPEAVEKTTETTTEKTVEKTVEPVAADPTQAVETTTETTTETTVEKTVEPVPTEPKK